jgi:hypothetical protein
MYGRCVLKREGKKKGEQGKEGKMNEEGRKKRESEGGKRKGV